MRSPKVMRAGTGNKNLFSYGLSLNVFMIIAGLRNLRRSMMNYFWFKCPDTYQVFVWYRQLTLSGCLETKILVFFNSQRYSILLMLSTLYRCFTRGAEPPCKLNNKLSYKHEQSCLNPINDACICGLFWIWRI